MSTWDDVSEVTEADEIEWQRDGSVTRCECGEHYIAPQFGHEEYLNMQEAWKETTRARAEQGEYER